MCNNHSIADPDVPEVSTPMKKAREIVQYFNKSTQATKKLKDQQQESSLAKYSGQPKNILQDVRTRWWSTYRMLKRLRYLREAISHYVVDNPQDSDLVNLTPEEWRVCHQVEVTLQTMAFWQRILEGEKYVTGSLVPLAIFTIRQSFVQVIASAGSDQFVKKLTRILLDDFDRRYHPTTGVLCIMIQTPHSLHTHSRSSLFMYNAIQHLLQLLVVIPYPDIECFRDTKKTAGSNRYTDNLSRSHTQYQGQLHQ